MSIITIIDEMEKELVSERSLLTHMNSRRLILPPGFLKCEQKGDDCYYSQIVRLDGRKEGSALDPFNDEHRLVIRELMEKKTIIHGAPILTKNIRAMERCLADLRPYHPSDQQFGELLGPEYYLDDELCVRDWKRKPDCMNPAFPEHRIHETKSGKLVRSKSEVLIADMLYDSGIDFKYEPQLMIDGKLYYPDFEILHPTLRILIWWEHLGLLDDPNYVFKSLEKTESLARGGIVQGKNLIITKEMPGLPLTRGAIEEAMRYYRLV